MPVSHVGVPVCQKFLAGRVNFVAGKTMPPVDRPLTTAQRDLLVDVQFKRRVLAGRDTLYAAVKQHLQRTGSDVPMPTKVQIAAWLGHQPAYTRQQSTGASLPEHKPVAVIRRS